MMQIPAVCVAVWCGLVWVVGFWLGGYAGAGGVLWVFECELLPV